MTETHPYALPLLSVPRASSKTLANFHQTLLGPIRPVPQPTLSRAIAAVPSDDLASDGILIGLTLVTLPAVIYSLLQVLNLIPSGALDHAVRAFLF